MAQQKIVTDALAKSGRNVRSRVREAVFDILDLVWTERSDKFAFADNPDVDARVNEILRQLSDGFLEDARNEARNLLKSLEYDDWEDESLEYAEREIDGETMLFRFDMQASHLKELLECWVAVASVYGLSKWQLWTSLNTYLANPMASELWRGAGFGALKWGKGYDRNIVEAIQKLIRDYMERAYQFATLLDYAEQGAVGYTIHRGSFYDCPLCDSYLDKVYPIDTIILPLHSNCCCYTEPVFANE